MLVAQVSSDMAAGVPTASLQESRSASEGHQGFLEQNSSAQTSRDKSKKGKADGKGKTSDIGKGLDSPGKGQGKRSADSLQEGSRKQSRKSSDDTTPEPRAGDPACPPAAADRPVPGRREFRDFVDLDDLPAQGVQVDATPNDFDQGHITGPGVAYCARILRNQEHYLCKTPPGDPREMKPRLGDFLDIRCLACGRTLKDWNGKMQHCVNMSEKSMKCWEYTSDIEKYLYNNQHNSARYYEILEMQSRMAQKIQTIINTAKAEGKKPDAYLMCVVSDYDKEVWRRLVENPVRSDEPLALQPEAEQ